MTPSTCVANWALGAALVATGCAADPEGSAPAGATGSTSGSGPAASSEGEGGPATTGESGETGADDDTGGEEPPAESGTDEGSDSTGEPSPPEQRVPVLVSIAHGGQTAMSCDRGRTWQGFHEFGPQDDHNPYAAFGGITYGNGAFVAATGWGAPAHVLRSEDGLTWDDRPDAAFINERGQSERPDFASGIEFNGEKFLLFANGVWESTDGLSWQQTMPEALTFNGHFREVEYLPEPDLLLIAFQLYDDAGFEVQVSADGGQSWARGTGVDAGCFGYVQHRGGFAFHDGRIMLAGGPGPTCVSDDDGLTWTAGPDSGVFIADLKADTDGFLLHGEDGTLLRSEDGTTWTTLGTTEMSGRIGWYPEVGYIGADPGYAYAEVPTSWNGARAPAPEGFGAVREFALGSMAPTDDCPLAQ